MLLKSELDILYKKYNRKKYIHPDPLEFLYKYRSIRDREIAALIASSLAYGRVKQILKSVNTVLSKMGNSPYNFIKGTTDKQIAEKFSGFKHRFTTDSDIISLIKGIKVVITEDGSLNNCFLSGDKEDSETIIPALDKFVSRLNCKNNYLIPLPSRGSACKRLNLFLRWMIRKDSVDPGGWKGISAGRLIIPLDTHMAKIGYALGFTKRKTPDMKMALDITRYFSKLEPDDPVKYDFVLTRFGIRKELNITRICKTLSTFL